MYSRNFGISIPKNYSGNRFSTPAEPTTKTHRADIKKATKSSHSPSFVTRNIPVSAKADESGCAESEETVLEKEKIPISGSDEATDPFYIEESDYSDNFSEYDEDFEENHQKNEERVENATRAISVGLSGIQSFLSGIEKDELIILGLIFLFISDSANKNSDIIAILALLLLL